MNNEGKMLQIYVVWVDMNQKYLIIYPMPKPYNTSLEDLFDPEGSALPKLVEINMTNKPMGPLLI